MLSGLIFALVLTYPYRIIEFCYRIFIEIRAALHNAEWLLRLIVLGLVICVATDISLYAIIGIGAEFSYGNIPFIDTLRTIVQTIEVGLMELLYVFIGIILLDIVRKSGKRRFDQRQIISFC